MNQSEAIRKAEQFAQNAYAAAAEDIVRERRDDILKLNSKLARFGVVHSSVTVVETARIIGEQIRALIQARLNSILEGYEIYGVSVDDEMATCLSLDLVGEASQMIDKEAKSRPFAGMGMMGAYARALEQSVSISAVWARVQIDRRRLVPKNHEHPPVTTIYNVQGDNARVNVNSSDHSVNVVTKSNDEFFATLRGLIETEIADGDERRKILEALTVLKESHGKPSFGPRYTDFIAAAANHMTLLAPFIPALTEMLHKVI